MHGVMRLMFATIITSLLFFSIILLSTLGTWFFPNISITKTLIIYGVVLFYFTVWSLYFLLGLFDR